MTHYHWSMFFIRPVPEEGLIGSADGSIFHLNQSFIYARGGHRPLFNLYCVRSYENRALHALMIHYWYPVMLLISCPLFS